MRPLDACMCSVDSRRRLRSRCRHILWTRYLQNRWSESLVILNVGHYPPDHGFDHGSVIFIKMGAIFIFTDLVNALSQEPRVRITRNCVCTGPHLPDHEMKVLVGCQKLEIRKIVHSFSRSIQLKPAKQKHSKKYCRILYVHPRTHKTLSMETRECQIYVKRIYNRNVHAATQETTSAHLTVHKPLIHYHWLNMNVYIA